MSPSNCDASRRSPRQPPWPSRRQRGQAMLEFVFAALLAISIILGIIQIALVFNAHHMVQLAAFNAARAAIVARNSDSSKPDEAVEFDEMKSKAHQAAFFTLLPVIPDLHGILPTSLGGVPGFFQNLLTSGPNSNAFTSLLGVGMEFFAIEVKFFRVDKIDDADEMKSSDIAAMAPGGQRIEFDDRSKADDNLITVVVSWNYPLVIPFANRIFFAATNPLAYATAWIVQHPEYAQQNPLTTLRLLSGDVNAVPVWGQGLEFEILINRTVGTGTAGEFARRLLYRVPIKASYIMRMQWDRKP